MTTFTRTWDAAYEATPADTANASVGAQRIRETRIDVQERLEVDHSHAGNADDGTHKQVTFVNPLGSDPSTVTDQGYLYTKNISSVVELFFKDEAANVLQLTTGGAIKYVVDGTGIEVNSGSLRLKDNGVTLAKMAGLVRGKIIYGDSSGDPAALTVGAANKVLFSNGTDISWDQGVKGPTVLTEQALAGDTLRTFAHSLGAVPSLYVVVMRCTSTDAGFSVNEEIPMAGMGSVEAAETRGVTVSADATNIFVSMGDQLYLISKISFNDAQITPAKWNIKVRVWA